MFIMHSVVRWMSYSVVRRVSCCIAGLALWMALASDPMPQTTTPAEEWQTLNQRVIKAHQAGQVNEAVPLAEQTLALARQAFGPHHPDTLTSMNNLAFALTSQG